MAIELTSKGTKAEEQETKPTIYAKMGIEYLFLYDVLGEYLKPPPRLRHGRGYPPYFTSSTWSRSGAHRASAQWAKPSSAKGSRSRKHRAT